MSNEKNLKDMDKDELRDRKARLRKKFQDDRWELQSTAGDLFLDMVKLKYEEVAGTVEDGFKGTEKFLEYVDEVEFFDTMMSCLEVFGEDGFDIDVYINLKDEKDKKEEDKDEVI